MRVLPIVFAMFLVTACGKQEATQPASSAEEAPSTYASETETKPMPSLDEILAMQDEDMKARYEYRHPKDTLGFFGIEPGMTVVEALPGGGWYSKILIPYLGSSGKLVGVDYDVSMWPNFSFVTDEFLDKRKTWPDTWPGEAGQWYGDDGASIEAYTFATLPADMSGKADAVLFIRALHNLARFDDQGQFLQNALEETRRVLKPGGIVGVVQHEAAEDKNDEWADGSRGYLKKSMVINAMEKAGFSLVAESDLNVNPKDQPGDEDIVWRLPPNYATSKEDEEAKAQFAEIGESNRMTLLFRKDEA